MYGQDGYCVNANKFFLLMIRNTNLHPRHGFQKLEDSVTDLVFLVLLGYFYSFIALNMSEMHGITPNCASACQQLNAKYDAMLEIVLHPSLWILALLSERLFLFEETQLFELLFCSNLIFDYHHTPPPPPVASNFI